jgi:hypothetical protein
MSTLDTIIKNINNILFPNKIVEESTQSIQLTDTEILQNKLIEEEIKQNELINQIINEENMLKEKIIKEEENRKISEESLSNPNIEFEKIDETFSYNMNRNNYYNEFFGNNNDNFIKLNIINIKSKEIFILIILVLILYLVLVKN